MQNPGSDAGVLYGNILSAGITDFSSSAMSALGARSGIFPPSALLTHCGLQ
jgi:hypothetical protein